MTKNIKCACDHEFQDKTYGKQVRVHNKRTSKENEWKCTICQKINKG
jgi:hypothetical protein